MPPLKIEDTGPTYAEVVREGVRQAGLALGRDDLARTLHDDADHFGAFAFCDEPACVDIARAAR